MAKKKNKKAVKAFARLEQLTADLTDEQVLDAAIRMNAKIKRIKAGKE